MIRLKQNHPFDINGPLMLAVHLQLPKRCQFYLTEVVSVSVIRSQGPMTEGLV
jgi:hypothetical protein